MLLPNPLRRMTLTGDARSGFVICGFFSLDQIISLFVLFAESNF
jgi:hypothetical protein